MHLEKLNRHTAVLGMIGLASLLVGGCGGSDPAPAANVNQTQSGIPNVAPLQPAVPPPVASNTLPATGVVNPASTNPPPPVAQPDSNSDSDPFAAGKRVFAANNCGRCHAGLGGAGMAAGGQGAGFPASMAGGPGGGGRPGGGSPGGGPPGGGPPDGGFGGGGPGGGRPGGGGPIGGMGGRPGMAKGPDLSHVGSDPAHTVEWLIAHIRNPKSHKPDSRMPAFDAKISEEDLKALAEYLASLK